jgi:multiple sugar transport system permease protein
MARAAQPTALQRTEGRTGVGPPVPRFPRLPRILHAVFVYTVLILASLFILLPVGWMLTAALKPDTAPVFTFPPEWFPTQYWHWQTFRDALFKEEFIRYTANSLFLVVMTVTGAVFSSSLIAFPFARLRFRGKNVLFTFLIATMLLPAPVLLIPQFLLFYQIGWYGTYYPLWVPAWAGNAFFIFLMRQYMRAIPIELDEAARVDGAGYWTIYWRIVMPLCVPVLTVAAVFQFIGTWNDFFGPLIYLDDPEKFTVALALARLVQKVGTEWNEVMAANLIVILPVLVVYFFAQDKLIGGIANVGLKG